jgi:hypothetical protein
VATYCPPGDVVISGSYTVDNAIVDRSYPGTDVTGNSGWFVRGYAGDFRDPSHQPAVYVSLVCLAP